ncbi:hypothetical protein E3A20_29170, partial [Planctomyces bekefii]
MEIIFDRSGDTSRTLTNVPFGQSPPTERFDR